MNAWQKIVIVLAVVVIVFAVLLLPDTLSCEFIGKQSILDRIINGPRQICTG